ncbi:hypothetical protein FV225_11945 [Methylobacterium sp. WL93]|uniref:hypothetical protein n=1 Tax=Methylobacterium sp. WL93 TaxID=2603892 RepID=UPI0011C7D3C1|nr:hypothetical protein [Methylobacterium sp. WL93]TXN38879.1 hypothetical protein FV225_11945 [Methylobacterium sp. WL93]
MKSAETTTTDVAEIAVLARAKRNFQNNGLGDRMWGAPGAADEPPLSEAFFLSEDQRADFIAAARAEIEAENGSPHQADASAPYIEGEAMSFGISALYGSRDDAQSAKGTLIASGIPEGAIRLIVCPAIPPVGCSEPGEPTPADGVLHRQLREIGLPAAAWGSYCAKLAGGGAMLNLHVEETEVERVMGILKDHSSVDVEQRVATWDLEGWGGTSPVSTEGWGGYSATSTGGTKITASQD